jgi:hypothetical protein
VRRASILMACLFAGPAVADDADLLHFMGGHGCTIGADSKAAATSAGFDAGQIDALVDAALSDGTASQQRAYVVLSKDICTIRLPAIQSAYTVTSPEVLAVTSAIDAYAADGAPGCFLGDTPGAFDALRGDGRGAGFGDYIAFIGAGIISGEMRFYSPSPLHTPISFQVTTGACAKVLDIDAINQSHAFIASGFGDYIRLLGAENACDGSAYGMAAAEFATRVQGADPKTLVEYQPGVNAWLFFEYDLIAMAAGWHEGMSGTEKGTPRPPLCHYP